MQSSLTTPAQIPYITFNTIGCIIVGATSKHDIQQCRMVSLARTILCNWKCESALHEACCLFGPSLRCCATCLSFTISEKGTANRSVIDIWLLNTESPLVYTLRVSSQTRISNPTKRQNKRFRFRICYIRSLELTSSLTISPSDDEILPALLISGLLSI